MTSPNPRVYCRPYTSPLIRNPTYPTITVNHEIRELPWEERPMTLEPVKNVVVLTSDSCHKLMPAGQYYYTHAQLQAVWDHALADAANAAREYPGAVKAIRALSEAKLDTSL